MTNNKIKNYKRGIGTIDNAETINIHNELGQLGVTSGSVPDRALLAPTLIDRGPPINQLIERLEEMLDSGSTYPLLVVVPGCADDLHQALVVRCALIEFIKDFGGSGAWRYLKRLTWPEGATRIIHILQDVRDRLGLPKVYRKLQDIETNIVKVNQHLCWCHFVDLDDWRQDEGALVKKWVDYFLSGSLRCAPEHFLVAFLCLVVDEDPGPTSKQVQQFIDELKAMPEEMSARLLVTPDLSTIRQKHVADWVGEAAHYIGDDVLEPQLLALPNELYKNRNEQPLRLADVYQKVADALTSAFRGRVRAVENDSETR